MLLRDCSVLSRLEGLIGVQRQPDDRAQLMTNTLAFRFVQGTKIWLFRIQIRMSHGRWRKLVGLAWTDDIETARQRGARSCLTRRGAVGTDSKALKMTDTGQI